MSDIRRILYCHCSFSDAPPKDVKSQVLRGLIAAGAAFDAVPDLCALAARRDPMLLEVSRSPGAAIVACHERAVRWLLGAAGAPLDAPGPAVLNMRTQTAEAILQSLLPDRPRDVAPGVDEKLRALRKSLKAQADASSWIPWFPVLDYGRCNHCGQCADFCLFGVYGKSPKGEVQVQHPAKCKTHCPACARICPEAAILFPKHPTGPINGGEPPADAAAEPMNVDLSKLSREDIYAALRARGKAANRRSAPDGGRPDGPGK